MDESNSTANRIRRASKVDPIRNEKDIAAIKDLLKESPRDYALFTVGINTGLRSEDLLSLKFGDILTPKGSVRTRRFIGETKTGKAWQIVFTPRTQAALAGVCPVDGDVDPEAYLFASRKGGRLTIQGLHQLVNKWTHSAGIKGNFGTNTLRKTFAYHILKQGLNINTLMRRLNHASPSVTLRYAGIEKDEIAKVVLKLNF